MRALTRRSDRRVGVGASGPPKGRALVYRRCPTREHRRRERPRPRGARPAEYREPASRPARSPIRQTIRITNTLRPDYRTAEPSDSPPPGVTLRVERLGLAELDGGPWFGATGFRSALNPLLAPRRSPHGSGPSPPSRAASLPWLTAAHIEAFPLDRALWRPARMRASRGATARGRDYQLSSSTIVWVSISMRSGSA